MFALAFDAHSGRPAALELDSRRRQVARILEARQRVMEGKDLLYCAPEVRRLIENEMTTLIALACGR
jgi:hypothetical protein